MPTGGNEAAGYNSPGGFFMNEATTVENEAKDNTETAEEHGLIPLGQASRDTLGGPGQYWDGGWGQWGLEF